MLKIVLNQPTKTNSKYGFYLSYNGAFPVLRVIQAKRVLDVLEKPEKDRIILLTGGVVTCIAAHHPVPLILSSLPHPL